MNKMKIFGVLVFGLVFLNSCKKTSAISAENIPSKKVIQDLYKPSATFDHISYIRENSRIGSIDGEEFEIKYFVDYVILNFLEKPEYKKYITDRKLLRKLKNEGCWDNYVLISDTLSNGDDCRIEIRSQEFKPKQHKLKYDDKSNFLDEVDGKYPFGAVYSKYPSKELESVSIEINKIKIDTRISKYKNLYEAQFCNFGTFQKITEAYEDGDNIYIYIFGGNAADTYFAKLIFNTSSGFVTSIISDYVPMSRYRCFGSHFIGF